MASRAERARSFGAVAADYDRLRPPAPPQAVDWLLPASCPVAVDVGAGTGLLARRLAATAPRVGRVIAVEPDERMRAVLAARSPGIEVIAGRGESIPLPDASADGVFISSAWHWMDPELAVPEITRVLRDGGRLGMIWSTPDRGADLLRGLLSLRGEPGPAGGETAFGGPAGDGPAGDGPAGDSRRGGRRRDVQLPGGAALEHIATAEFRYTRTMATADLVAMLGTYSAVITADSGERDAWRARATAVLAERFPGVPELDLPVRSWCWRADRVPRGAGPVTPPG
jgi:SAM-dependent methyltransferase